MANPVRSNIIKSGAVLWFAPEGESLPDETTIGTGDAWGGNWERVGYTNAPLTFTYEDERMAISVEEMLVDFDEWRTKESCKLETTLAELIADYMALLTGDTPSVTPAGAGQVGYESFSLGNNDRVTVYAIGFEGIRYDEDSNALPVRIFIPRGTFKMNGDIEWSRRTDTYVNLPIMVNGLGDPTTGKVAVFQRVTAPAA